MMTRVTFEEGVAALNGCGTLVARDVREISELVLRIRLVEARVQNKPYAFSEAVSSDIPAILIGAKPVEPDNKSIACEVTFGQGTVVSYTVLNESYGRYPQPPEVFTGKLFREFQTSHLLDFVRRNTDASDEYPGKLRHFEIVSANEVFDIIATAAPEIFCGSWREVMNQPDW